MTGKIPSYSVRLSTSSVSNKYQKPFPNKDKSQINQGPTGVTISNNKVSEDTPDGYQIGILTAIDPNPKQRHAFQLLDDAGGRFKIVGNRLLRWWAELDYETDQTHTITVRVIDEGELFVDAPLTIEVLNVYENPKDMALSGTSVPENSVIGTIVGTVSVIGSEAGMIWTYTCTSDAGGRFTMDGDNLVTATLGFDYELGKEYTVTIRADNQFNNFIAKTFTIMVTDVNEAPTDIILSSSAITEDAPAGAWIGTLTLVDPEKDPIQTFTLLDDAGGRFAISGNTLVRGATALDYETATSHDIIVVGSDSGGLTFEKPFTINVIDVDEQVPNNAPTDIILSDRTVVERSIAGTFIGNLSAVDPDVGDTHTFQLLNSANGRFAIQGNRLVTGQQTLRYNEGNQTISIRVTDSKGATFDKTFSIQVTNIPDAPTDIHLSSNVVPENSPAGTFIGTLTTTDPDPDESFTYALTNNQNNRFRVTGNKLETGTTLLDYEAQTAYTITVKVTDKNGLTYTKDFEILVSDVYESEPTNPENIVNDYIPSSNGVAPYQLPYIDFPVGRQSTAPLKKPQGLPGITISGTMCYIDSANLYEDVDFRGLNIRNRVSGSTFRNCLFDNSHLPLNPTSGQSPVIANNYNNGGSQDKTSFDLEFCSYLGKRDDRGEACVIWSKGRVNTYRLLIDGASDDGIRTFGGFHYENAHINGGWSASGHQDIYEWTGASPEGGTYTEFQRIYADVTFSYGSADQNGGTSGFMKNWEELGNVLPAGYYGLFEEIWVEHKPNWPTICWYAYVATGSSGTKVRVLNCYALNMSGQYMIQKTNPHATGQGGKEKRVGWTAWQDNASIQASTVPVKITDFAASSPDNTSIAFSFTTPANTSYVEFRSRINGSARWSYWRQLPTGKVVSGFTSNTKYEVQIRAVNLAVGGGTSGPKSDIKVVQVGSAQPQLPGNITNLAVASTGPSSVTLAFTDAPGATSYEYRTALNNVWSAWAVLNNKTITGLASSTNYTIEVRGKNSAGSGTASSITATTQSAGEVPSTIANLAVQSKTDTTVTMTFSPATGADSYQYQRDTGAWTGFTPTGTTTLTFTVSGLTQNTAYTFKVRGVNTTGNGAASNTVNVTTNATSTGDAEWQALKTRMTTAGATPSTAWENAYKDLITAMKNAGIWSEGLVGYVAGHSYNTIQLNWFGNQYDGVKSGTLKSFIVGKGAEGNYSWYMDTGFNPVTQNLGQSYSIVYELISPPMVTWTDAWAFGNFLTLAGLNPSTFKFSGKGMSNTFASTVATGLNDKPIYMGSSLTSTFEVDTGTTVENVARSLLTEHENANFRFQGRGGEYAEAGIMTCRYAFLFRRNLTTTERAAFRTALNAYKTAIQGLT